jgi:hypothetical protein
MTTAEERAAAREAALREQMETQRRIAEPGDYVWDKAQEKYWDLRDGTLHNEKAVDASIPLSLWRAEVQANGNERLIPPSKDICRIEFDQTVEGSTWWPGRPQIIRDVFIDQDGYRPAAGRRIYNQYREPPAAPEGPAEAQMWVEHVRALWPEDCEYFFDYCAHMVQRPQEKCNTAIVLSGAQGIGKDAALNPVKAAIGMWNAKNIDPDELFSAYRPWLQTVMLVIDEVRPSKDEFHASSMYNILKPMIATPPETLPLNNKYMALRYVINVMRVFITTNDWMAMYIPSEDRRMYIMHSPQKQCWQDQKYFSALFGWFDSGGSWEVARWLQQRDVSGFAPKAMSRKTAGWEAITNTWGEPEDAIDQALEMLGRPDCVFGMEMAECYFDGADDIQRALKSPRKIGHRMQRAGYLALACPTGQRWVFNGKKRIQARLVFVRQGVSKADAIRLVEDRGARLARGESLIVPREGKF